MESKVRLEKELQEGLRSPSGTRLKKAVGKEGIISLILLIGFFGILCTRMGIVNMFNTMMNTAYSLIINVALFIMGVAVLAGAVSSIMSEFGIISLVNKVLAGLMKPFYNLPGAAALGVVTTYLSDNPAIITLANDKGFRKYFKKYQLPALTNIGTAFGMGLIVTTFMMGQAPEGESFIGAVLLGNLGAVFGSIISVKLMMKFTKKEFGTEEMVEEDVSGDSYDILRYREIREGSVGGRLLEATLEGGKSGVELGLAVIPGVVIICTIVTMLTNGPAAIDNNGIALYTGAANEGIEFLPWIGKELSFILNPLFGFSSPEAIAFPITALGAVGAAIGLVPDMISTGKIGANEIAVFTAMGMCWSGYLSTHVAMMDSLGCRNLTGKAIISHTIGGLVAGISANLLFNLFF